MPIHGDILMRTTVDLPDDLYRALKARAGLSGMTIRQLARQLIEQGLHPVAEQTGLRKRHAPPPVIIPPRGVPIPATSRAELTRME